MDQQQNQNTSFNNVVPPFQNGMTNNPSSKKIGPIITALIIVLVLIIGTLFILASRANKETTLEENAIDNSTTTQTVAPVTGTSDDIDSLQSDLNSSTEGVDAQSI